MCHREDARSSAGVRRLAVGLRLGADFWLRVGLGVLLGALLLVIAIAEIVGLIGGGLAWLAFGIHVTRLPGP
jgi:hypothetical protein